MEWNGMFSFLHSVSRHNVVFFFQLMHGFFFRPRKPIYFFTFLTFI